METSRIEELVEECLPKSRDLQKVGDHYWGGDYEPTYYELINLEASFREILKPKLRQVLTEAHQAGRDEAVEERPDEPTRWVSEPMTQKEAEIYVQGMYDLMMMVGCDGHCKHYDPLFFEGNTAHSYVLDLDDGGRHHSYVTPQWVALKALLEFAQTLKDEWEISGWNEYFADNTRRAIEEIEALQDNK